MGRLKWCGPDHHRAGMRLNSATFWGRVQVLDKMEANDKRAVVQKSQHSHLRGNPSFDTLRPSHTLFRKRRFFLDLHLTYGAKRIRGFSWPNRVISASHYFQARSPSINIPITNKF